MLANLLTSQEGLKDGIISLLLWDESVFENFTVPNGLDKDTAVDYIINKAGKTPLMHPDPEYMKYYIGVWSRIRNPIWEKLYASTQFEYNPIYNTDRTNSYTDTRQIERGREGSSTRNQDMTQNGSAESDTTSNGTDTGTVENQVSAENADTYQPDRNEIRDLATQSSGHDTTTTEQTAKTSEDASSTENETTTETFTHEEHAEGNIGVTTTQQMIKEEREIVNFSVYDVIVDDFVERFCLYVW